MNIKYNKRLLKLALISFAIALILTAFGYKVIKKSTQPERTEKIAYFKKTLERDTIIEESDIELIDTPVSLIPNGYIKDKSSIKDKRVVSQVEKGDFALQSKFITRGDMNVNVDDMWTIGIDVDNISNFIGVQLKEGEFYNLVHVNEESISTASYKVKAVNIVDSSAKISTETDTSVPKTINIAVSTEEEMLEIAEKKRNGNFDMVKPTKEWIKTTNYNKVIESVEIQK